MSTLPIAAAIGLTIAGAALAFFGLRLVLRRLAVVAGALFAAAGLTGIVAIPLPGTWPLTVVVAAGQLLALGVMAYPRVEFDVATGIAGAAVLAGPFLLAISGLPENPLGVPVILVLVPMLQVWWRLEHASRDERVALLWLIVVAAPVLLVAGIVAFLDPPEVFLVPVVASFGLIGWAAWHGLTHPRDVDARAIAAAVAVNATAFVVVLALIRVTTTIAEGITGEALPPVPATLLAATCAFAILPARRYLRLVSDEILFGRRPDVEAAAGRVAREVGDSPDDALHAVLDALTLPYAELRLDGLPGAAVGTPVDTVETLPIIADGRRIGSLLVGVRAGDLHLTSTDRSVLALAAPLIAQALRSRALARSLQEARELAAGTREEERKRLRRDLHDSLGPRLSGIGYTADAAALSIRSPDAALEHLARIRAETTAAIKEIREVVNGLRPPALDELGLTEAIRVQAERLAQPDGRRFRVVLQAEELPPLSAAVDVAAYRIAVEALTNAARHSGAAAATIAIGIEGDHLTINVTDERTGTVPWTPGTGMASMRERAQELGGTLVIRPNCVEATLPVLLP